MGLKQISKGGGSNGLNVGDSIEGYWVGIETKQGKFGQNKNPVIRTETGEVELFSKGNLKYFEDDMKKAGAALGSKVRVTRKADYMHPKTNKLAASFEVLADPDDVIPLTTKPKKSDF